MNPRATRVSSEFLPEACSPGLPAVPMSLTLPVCLCRDSRQQGSEPSSSSPPTDQGIGVCMQRPPNLQNAPCSSPRLLSALPPRAGDDSTKRLNCHRLPLPPCYSALDAPVPSTVPGIQYVFNDCTRSELHGASPLKGAPPTRSL